MLANMKRPSWRAAAILAVGFAVGLLIVACAGSGAAPAPSRRQRPPRAAAATHRYAAETTATVASPTRPPARPPPAPPAPILRANARVSFAALQNRLAGEGRIAVAIEPLGHGATEVLGSDPPMQGMSTTKILILAALLRDRRGVAGLTPIERQEAYDAITQSDNQDILALFSVLEQDQGGLIGASAYATALLREGGDATTTVTTAPPPPLYSTTFGQTKWSPTAEVTFFRSLALGCLLPPTDTHYILELMRSIEPSESWGLGSAGFPSVAFKGGWGPEPGGLYGVRQTGIVGQGDKAAVVAIIAYPAATFDTGTAMLTQTALWLRQELTLTATPTGSCPS